MKKCKYLYKEYTMNYFPLADLPTDLQEMIVRKMDFLTWMNYELAIKNTISIPITKEECDSAKSYISSNTSSYISEESYDIDSVDSSDSCVEN